MWPILKAKTFSHLKIQKNKENVIGLLPDSAENSEEKAPFILIISR